MKIRIMYILLVLFLLPVVGAGAYTDEDCIRCHGGDSQESLLKMSMEQFKRSVHGKEGSCQGCHTNVLDEDHQETQGSGAVDCAACHDKFNQHGAGATQGRPKCFSCHTRHGILSPKNPRSSVHPDRLRQTCRSCHPVQSGSSGYMAWLPSIRVASHPKQDFSQVYDMDNCLGCHQGRAAHGETDPLNDQKCHTCHLDKDGKNKLWGVMHPEVRWDKQPGVTVAAVGYQLSLLVLVIGGFRWLVRRFSRVSKRKE
ncbi:MAG: hypothetical protein LJE94_16420 [Deltaproteobacteria bacterium]|nr:hypothetical protein [Deltaproteobacteria bacterium]